MTTAWLTALALTLAEIGTTHYFGSRAFRLTVPEVTYVPVGPGQWYPRGNVTYEARVRGGALLNDTTLPNTRAQSFRPTRWTPWPHLAEMLYHEDLQGEGGVIWWFD